MADENFYASCIRQLLDSDAAEQFNSMLTEMLTRWSPAFNEYFSECLESALTMSASFAARRVVALPYHGITNNVSESYNRVLKDFQNWKVYYTLTEICATCIDCY